MIGKVRWSEERESAERLGVRVRGSREKEDYINQMQKDKYENRKQEEKDKCKVQKQGNKEKYEDQK